MEGRADRNFLTRDLRCRSPPRDYCREYCASIVNFIHRCENAMCLAMTLTAPVKRSFWTHRQHGGRRRLEMSSEGAITEGSRGWIGEYLHLVVAGTQPPHPAFNAQHGNADGGIQTLSPLSVPVGMPLTHYEDTVGRRVSVCLCIFLTTPYSDTFFVVILVAGLASTRPGVFRA